MGGDHPQGGLHDRLFGDAEMAAILSDRAMIRAMLRVEAALAEAQAALGVIPTAAAREIARAAAALDPDPARLAPLVAQAGIATQPVIAALRKAAGDAGEHVHHGATSQDILDTALTVQLAQALALLRRRIAALSASLSAQALRHADLPIPARTRFQLAAPTTLGARIALWAGPLRRHLDRLDELSPRLLLVSLHGAAGTAAALGPQAADTQRLLAEALGLGVPDGPWHATRDGVAELASWTSLVTGGLGKMGADLVLTGMSEIAELSAGIGGGSSTMPQKSNPVAAEALVTLARMNAGDLATMHHALIHAQERDGSALALEWLTLPGMLQRSAAALRLAGELADSLAPRPARIAAGFAADRGAMMAEKASFVLARSHGRAAALDLVARALGRMSDEPELTLAGALSLLAPGPDWRAELDPAACLGQAPETARRIAHHDITQEETR